MATVGETVPKAAASESSPARTGLSTSPVAVVWCRQVDNEAESPGYTTVPEEFPGQRETLEVIRAVGHLTVNVADTHDYWDPDPSQPLSYYPNIFLYPAFGGRYICLGRMFLSTEDRPRLGMKTLVLDTAQLLATGDFGGTIARWHASMGGPRRDGVRPPPVPDPSLFSTVGEGFLFHRGSTDPVLLVASDDWEAVMQAILDLIRSLPASLVSLGAILAFPYFLPQPKTNLHEFTEQLPLALALMRVPRAEAAGDRHNKRMSSWETAPVTLRDLTQGVPNGSRTKETIPLVLQYLRDHAEAKLRPISQRVDLVEGPRVKAHLADPERQGGRDRRKEMWRIGTAMESAAMLLQRSRGRHVPVTGETAKRAQEYLQARLPENEVRAPASEPVLAPVLSAAVGGGQVPPWLQRAGESPAPPAAPAGPEVVPVSTSDDPSLLKSPAPAPLPPVVARPVAPSIDPVALRLQIEKDVLMLLEERLASLRKSAPPPSPATALDDALKAELDARIETRIANAVMGLNAEVSRNLESALARQEMAAETRLKTAIDSVATPGPAHQLDPKLTAELAGRVDAQIAVALDAARAAIRRDLEAAMQQSERSQSDRLAGALAKLPPPGPATALDEKLKTELDARIDARIPTGVAAVGTPTRKEFDQLRTELRSLPPPGPAKELDDALRRDLGDMIEARIVEALGRADAARDEKLKAALRTLSSPVPASALDEKLKAELDARTSGRIAAALQLITGQIKEAVQAAEEREGRAREDRLSSVEARVALALEPKLVGELDKKIAVALETRAAEIGRRLDETVAKGSARAKEETQTELRKAVADLEARIGKAEDELRAGLSAQLDLHLQEAADRELQGRVDTEQRLTESIQARFAEVEGKRLKEHKELEQRLGVLVDGRNRDTHEKLSGLTQQQEAKLAGSVDQKVAAAQERLQRELESRLTEAQEARVHALADLQVRLQSFFEQKLREEQEGERQKYLELLARLKGEIESSLARMVDSSRFDSALREKIGRSLETFRAETQRAVDARLATAEQRLQVDRTDSGGQLARIEQALEERRTELHKLEEVLRTDMDDLDRRSQILSDRLVPIVRKTWLRVAEIQQAGSSAEVETQLNQLRREMNREFQRMEADQVTRTNELRERMETTIAHQGRVWLTLIHQLSQLTGDRRGAAARRPAAPRTDGDEFDLESLPSMVREEDPVNPMDPEPEEDRTPRRTPSPAEREAARRRLRRSDR